MARPIRLSRSLHARLLAISTLLAGCSAAHDLGPQERALAYRSAAPFVIAPSAWTPCSAHSDVHGSDATCATVQVPLSWVDAHGPQIDVFIKRIAAQANRRQQVWLLGQDAGRSSVHMEAEAMALLQRVPDAEVFLVDYRGTGRSDRLACAEEDLDGTLSLRWFDRFDREAKVARCYDALIEERGDALASFNLDETAMDLSMLIQATLRALPVAVYARGFGQQVIERAQQLRADLVIDRLIVGTSLPWLSSAREHAVDAAARQVLDACALDAACGEHLSHPLDAIEALLSVVERNPNLLLRAGLNAESLRWILADAVAEPSWRSFVAPIVFRAQRHNSDDLRALLYFSLLPLPEIPIVLDSDARRLLAVAEDITLGKHQEWPLDLTGLIATSDAAAIWRDVNDAVPVFDGDPIALDSGATAPTTHVLDPTNTCIERVASLLAGHDVPLAPCPVAPAPRFVFDPALVLERFRTADVWGGDDH